MGYGIPTIPMEVTDSSGFSVSNVMGSTYGYLKTLLFDGDPAV